MWDKLSFVTGQASEGSLAYLKELFVHVISLDSCTIS